MVFKIALNAIPKLGQAGWKVLVPLGVGTAAAVGAGVKGGVDTAKGRSIRKEVLNRFDDAVTSCEVTRVSTERSAQDFGQFQMRAHSETVARLADWLERNEQLVKRLNFKKVDGVRIRVPNIPKYVANAGNVSAGITGIVGAVGAGAAAPAAALWGVTSFATASTGTAISGLSGIAAQNATLAWLGGGALATGGGGIAAGGAVLSVVAIVPALLIGGMTMGLVGVRTKSRSRDFATKVEVEIKQIGLAQDLLGATDRRIHELWQLLSRLTDMASTAIDELEAVDFDPKLHASLFLRSLQLVTAVKEVLNTPVLDATSGDLSEASIEILRKYA